MTLAAVRSLAEELASLVEGASPLDDAARDSFALHLERRDDIVWRLGAACTPDIVSAATPEERQRLAELLRRVERATAAQSAAAEAAQQRAQSDLSMLGTHRQPAPPMEPRMTERLA